MVSCRYINNWIKSFEVKKFLGRYNYHLEFLDKPYITGPTGCGKTSLLKLLKVAIGILEHGNLGPLTDLCCGFVGMSGKLFDEFTLETFHGKLNIIKLDHYHYWVKLYNGNQLVFESRCEDSSHCLQHDELQSIGQVNAELLADDRFDLPSWIYAPYDYQKNSPCAKTLKRLIDCRYPDWNLANHIANVPTMYDSRTDIWDYKWPLPEGQYPASPEVKMAYKDIDYDDDGEYDIKDIFIERPTRGELAIAMLAFAIAGKPGTILIDNIDLHMHCVTQSQMPHLMKLAASRGVQIIATTDSFHLFEDENFEQATDLLGITKFPTSAYNVIEQYNVVPTIANKRILAEAILTTSAGNHINAFGIRVGEHLVDGGYRTFGKKEFGDSTESVTEMVDYILDFINDTEHLIVVPKKSL